MPAATARHGDLAPAYDVPRGEPLAVARALARQFAATAATRDLVGGTPKAERDALRESGLLALAIPRDYGGLGADWTETLVTVRAIAQADGSLAHVYGFQHLLLATVRLFGQPGHGNPGSYRRRPNAGSGATRSTRSIAARSRTGATAGGSSPAKRVSAPARSTRRC
ncbi:hypothetical protein GCM10025795_01180 [Verticiella sediminum]